MGDSVPIVFLITALKAAHMRNQINVVGGVEGASCPGFKDGLVHFLIAESRVTGISAHNSGISLYKRFKCNLIERNA